MCEYECLQNQNLKVFVQNYIPSMWSVLYAEFACAEFEIFHHLNLNLVNLIFRLSNFVHSKFEVLHSTDFSVRQEDITTEQFSESMKTTGFLQYSVFRSLKMK